jgi:hypothetical protein
MPLSATGWFDLPVSTPEIAVLVPLGDVGKNQTLDPACLLVEGARSPGQNVLAELVPRPKRAKVDHLAHTLAEELDRRGPSNCPLGRWPRNSARHSHPLKSRDCDGEHRPLTFC